MPRPPKYQCARCSATTTTDTAKAKGWSIRTLPSETGKEIIGATCGTCLTLPPT